MEKKPRSSNDSNAKKNAASSKKKSGSSVIGTLLLIAIAAGLAAFVALRGDTIPSVTGAMVPVKQKYLTFDAFFKFYLTEHAHPTSRLLHVVGTGLFILLAAIRDFRIFVTLIASASVGLIVRALTVGVAHGFIEFGAMVVTFLLLNKLFTRSLGLDLLIIGYAFAWVGHFFFEHNTPATFIYPTFSLMGDFFMFYNVVTLQIPVKLPF